MSADITFGVCVGPNYNRHHLETLIESIRSQNIKSSYEILLIGIDQLSSYDSDDTTAIPFDESKMAGWITKKKNILAQTARYSNICIVHDYYQFPRDWYTTIISGEPWEVLMTPVVNKNGTRGADWLINPERMREFLDANPAMYQRLREAAPHETPKYVCGLPYHVQNMNYIQYVSGGYILAKTHVLLNVPLNEKLKWGDAEDLEWSERLVRRYPINIKVSTQVNIQKERKWEVSQIPADVLLGLESFYGEQLNDKNTISNPTIT